VDNNFLFRAEDDNEFIPLFSFNEQDMEGDKDMVVDDIIPILPLRNTVLFPGVVIPITVGRDKSIQAVKAAYNKDKLIGVVSQKDGNIEDPTPADLCSIGTVAKIIKMIKMQDGGTTIIIQGKKRFQLLEMKEEDPFFKASIKVLVEEKVGKEDQNFQAYLSNIKDLATQIIQLSPNFPSEAAMILKNIENPLFLINFVSSNLNVEIANKQGLLEENKISLKAEKLIQYLQQELQFVELKNKVANKTRTEIDKQQRDYFLQQQLKSIKDELGGDANDRELAEMKKKAENKKWPESAKKIFQNGLEKLERMHSSTPDYSVVYNHLDLILDLPWEEYTDDNYDLKNAKKVLDADHYGMGKIKNRILEYLAVLKIKGDMKSPILCFLGPPGIGKTSLGKSIAHAIGRKYVRVSLGG
jgi:ATP-dependent Lon protease